MLPVDSVLSQQQKHLYAMQILAVLIRRFKNGGGAMSDEEISTRLELPIRMIRTLLFDLVRTGILIRTDPSEKRPGEHFYVIAQPVEKITAKHLILSLDGLDNGKYMNALTQKYLGEYQKILSLLDCPPASLPIDELSQQLLPERKDTI